MKPCTYALFDAKTGKKMVGGTLPRSLASLDEAADWLLDRSELKVGPNGHVHCLYGDTAVTAYLLLDPAETPKGKAAMKAWRDAKRNAEDALAQRNHELERELEDLIDQIGIEAALARLKGD